MSSYYPFGTQIMINGIMYTVEDRGASGIENDIGRVDIFVPDHNEALRLGRYDTTAYMTYTGPEHHVRLNLATSRAQVEEAMDRITKYFR